VQLERIDEARTALRDGIEQARRQGNAHAAGEMSELLASLGAGGGESSWRIGSPKPGSLTDT
jgi:hypothetical protein